VCALNAVTDKRGRPGKPTDKDGAESFNGRLRQECLSAPWFLSLADAQAKIEAWRTYYNETRPHSALEWATPAEFARRCGLQAATAIPEEPEVPPSGRY
jgi:putative transposase